MADRRRVAVVVVTYNGLPWLERCLESVDGNEIVVVDHGSSDGTVELVRERFPEVRLIEQPNRGLAAGWNRGIAETSSELVLLLNADAWVEGDAIARMAALLEREPRAGIVGPLTVYPDGRPQHSVRGYPTLWRLATEYFFLRKLGPRTRLFNSFYTGNFRFDREREAEFLMGAALLVRRAAAVEVGPLDESFFLFSEEVDWCYRFRQAGWRLLFTPEAKVVHVGGAAHGGRLFREQVVGHVRFLDKHRGRRAAERARRLLAAALTLRGLAFRGARGASYRETAAFLRGRSVEEILEWRRGGGS